MKIQASLVIPIFNNEQTLVTQLNKCNEIMQDVCSHYEIIVCDDKSSDNSALLLKKHFIKTPSFTLVFHKKNKGIAKTIKELYKKSKFTYITLFSVDGDWNPKDIKRLLLSINDNDADIVIGKRTYKNYPFYRKLISFLYNLFPYLLFQVKTFDAGSIKAFRRDLLNKIPLISKNVFFEAELIIRASRMKKKVIAIPISFNKQRGNKGLGAKLSLVVVSLRDLINLRIKI